MKKEKPDLETFAAKMADKEDNPSMHELAKAFPEKTYKELEQYRNADRHEEANQIPLTESQRNLVDHIESAVEKSKTRLGTCITAEMRKDRTPLQENEELKEDQIKETWSCQGCLEWEEKYQKEHKLRQEAETETILVKGIGMNSPEMKAAKQKIEELHKEWDRVKEAQDALANALEVNESHQKLNGKLQERITELEEENKKLNVHFEKQITGARKAGM